MIIHPPLTEISTDILVIGGGLPGVCAAVAAAQSGADVTLVERGLSLGGNCGPEVGVHPSDAHRFHPYAVTTGIVGRFIEDAAFSAAKTSANSNHYNISSQWDSVMSNALKNEGVRLLRRHYAHSPEILGDRIVAVYCEDTAAYKRVKINVKTAVIDDSGDGNVSDLAGALWRQGREAREEFGERCAPQTADSVTMGSSLVALVRDAGHPVPFIPPEGTPPFHPGYGGMVQLRPGPDDTLYFFFPTETGGDINTITDDHEIYERLLGHLYSAWNRIKNEVSIEETKNWELVWVSSRVAKRESRRFIGDYILTQTDVESGRIFDDAIAFGGFAVDVHDPISDAPEYVKIKYYSIPPLYTIPYRCIYSKNIDNLLFASRLLSATHMAHGTVRLQRTLSAVGQAAGTAAALCHHYNCLPRDIYTGHISELQQILLREDCSIPGQTNRDKADLARYASVTADSETTCEVTGDAAWEPLDKTKGCELWDFGDRIDSISFLLNNNTDQDRKLTLKLYRFDPVRPWQEHGERKFFDYYKSRNEAEWGNAHDEKQFSPIGTSVTMIPPAFNGYIRFDVGTDVTEKNIYNDDDRILALLESCEGVDIAHGSRFYEFVRSVEGTEDGSYIVRPSAYLYKLEPSPLYGKAIQTVNGINRRYSTNPVNMWKPASLPASLTFRWEKPVRVSQLRITFDTLTRTYHEMPFECGKRVSGQCVKSFRAAFKNGVNTVSEREIVNNHNRVAVLDFKSLFVDSLTLTLFETWDMSVLPGVYEVRIY